MFGKLKDKLKGAIKKFSKDVSVDAVVEELPVDDKVSSSVVDDVVKSVDESSSVVVESSSSVVGEDSSVVDDVIKSVVGEDSSVVDSTSDKKKGFFGKLFSKKEIVDGGVVKEVNEGSSSVVGEDSSVVDELPVVDKVSSSVVGEDSSVVDSVVDKVSSDKKSGGFFSRLTKVQLSESKFEEIFWDLEVVLLENNVAVEVIEQIKSDMKSVLTSEKVTRKGIEELIVDSLKDSLNRILSVNPVNLLELVDKKSDGPFVICMIGINGSGKTTSLAKLIKFFQDNNKSLVVAAADTFRAAAIQQLEEHTKKLGVKLIKHDYNADPAAVAFDAVKHAKAKNIDVVLIDSAGRLHSNDNLMNELKKLIRINNPDMKIFVGEAITGNDCVEQAKLFDEVVGIDGIILAKADVDDKGGAAISSSFVTKKPILFLGTGQGYDDLEVFSSEKILKSLGF